MDYKKFQGMLRKLVGVQSVNAVAREIGVSPSVLLYYLTQDSVDYIPEDFLKSLCMLTPGKVSLTELANAAGWTLTTGCLQAKTYGNDFPTRAMFNAHMWQACAMDPRVEHAEWNSIEELVTFFIYVGSTEEIKRYEISEVRPYNGQRHLPAPYFFYVKMYYDIGQDHFCQTVFVYFMHAHHDKIILSDLGFLVGDIQDAGFKIVGGPGLQPYFPAVQVVNEQGKVDLQKNDSAATSVEEKGKSIVQSVEKNARMYSTTLVGYGFEIYDDPNAVEAMKLLQFLQNHRQTLVMITGEDIRTSTLADVKDLLQGYMDESTFCHGIGCIIAAIMSIETGISFMFWRDEDGRFPENKSCVMALDVGPGVHILDVIYPYALELGIPGFGACYFMIELEKQDRVDTMCYKKGG